MTSVATSTTDTPCLPVVRRRVRSLEDEPRHNGPMRSERRGLLSSQTYQQPYWSGRS